MDIAENLQRVLRTDSRTKCIRIVVEQRDATVQLQGVTNSFYQKQMVQTIALKFLQSHAHMLRLDNQIEVEDSDTQ